ncbi:MAG: SAM-dependent methyltransferase [Microbacteriaceae bacterium]|nr:SAM-dependent methyltransferase [Microbacteriaceae bacterium]
MNAPDLDLLLRTGTLRLVDELGAIRTTDEATAALLRLRKDGIAPELAATALTQARLRTRAVAKFGEFAARMLFTEEGLQQATRLGVAARHADRYRDAGLSRVADLGCGIGGDALAFAGLGLAVRAIDRDPVAAAIAAYNLAAFPDASVAVGAAEDVDLAGVDAVWLDPARRGLPRGSTPDSRRPARLDPADWSPSLDFAFGLADRLPTGVKLGPGLDHELLPRDREAQWVSDGGEVVELVVWSGALARPGVGRAALVIGAGGAAELTAAGDSEDVAAGELGEYLVEPDGAVIRARLIGDLARSLDPAARMLHETIAWVTLDTEPRTPFGQSFRVLDVLPLDTKAVRRALLARDAGAAEIKKRGVDIEPAEFRRRLKLPGGGRQLTVILTRLGARRRAILAERVPPGRAE